MSQPLLLNLRNLACGYRPAHRAEPQSAPQRRRHRLPAGLIRLRQDHHPARDCRFRAGARRRDQLAGEVISSAGFTLAPEKRRIGMVFQDYALFPT
jgi:iron(III) transport system ATP-binding protein